MEPKGSTDNNLFIKRLSNVEHDSIVLHRKEFYIIMKNNYDNWFYNQYKYLTGNRNGKETFNDTKWIEFIKRYKSLMDLHSTLPQDQPFGVMGNDYAFEQLIQLMSRSNYTFDDLNDSLIKTYKYSLKNCMGVNTVNTHVIIFQTKNTDSKHVTSNGSCYVIDVPFVQMNFGGRDEFIRQKIHDIHTTENQKYIPFNEFISNGLDDILGFSLLCTVNGFICNDCQVAIDDKGFKFKIKWPYSTDVSFIIYKLDTCFVHDMVVDSQQISSPLILPNQISDLIDKHGYGEYQCLLNIYDEEFKSTVPSVVNFGTLNKRGLSIVNLQNKTLDMIERNKSKSVHIVIYVLKNFHEVPNLYPAINYYELIETGKVYDDKHENIVDVNDNDIVMSVSKYENNLEICTPPISLDRSSSTTFNTIQSCLRLEADLMVYKDRIKRIGIALSNEMDGSIVMSDIILPLTDILPKLKSYYITYNEGCLLTSLIPSNYVSEFATFVTNLQLVLNKANEVVEQLNPNYIEISKYDIPQLYSNNYELFVKRICSPFKNGKLNTISRMKSLPPNFFINDNSTRFNRPVSPYCFMVLRYDQDEDCWLLDNPTIRHFHGISNTFYIDSKLSGKEIYKFFVFYTDTQNPAEKNLDVLNEENIIDFDLFINEVDKHMGFIRYWNIENKLLKYSKIMYNRYDQDTCIQVLSKILKNKIVDNEIMYDYPSQIEYELSAINQFSYKDYTDDTEYGPFALNYLFYTLNMMTYDNDKLQSYFVHCLTKSKYNNRFVDIPLSSLINSEMISDVNYSSFSRIPSTLDVSSCVFPETTYNAFYGYGNMISSSGSLIETNVYPYVFNVYAPDIEYPSIDNDGINKEYYLKFSSMDSTGYQNYSYNIDITLAKYMCKYLTAIYSYTSEFQTDYTTTFNKTWLCDMAIETTQTLIDDINKYLLNHEPIDPTTNTIITSIIDNNPFITKMNNLKQLYSQCIYIQYQGSRLSIFNIINELLSDLRYAYYMFGFDNYAIKSIRALYIHLKKINKEMNIYEFKRWISGIDYNLITILKNLMARNHYNDIPVSTFDRYADLIRIYVLQCNTIFDQITALIDSLSTSFRTNHMDPIIAQCLNVLNLYTFDMYTISNITPASSSQYSTKPYVVILTIDPLDAHFRIPNSSQSNVFNKMILIPICDFNGTTYTIKSLVALCKYTFFSGSKLTNMSGTIKSIDGTSLGNITCDIEFQPVSNTSTVSNNVQLLHDIGDLKLDFQHVHEVTNVDGNVISNEPRIYVNYELYGGNHFKPLDSNYELIKSEQGPIDRIYIHNTEINELVTESMSNVGSYGVYFKPSQVVHPIKDVNEVVTSVGGKYKPGQRLYLYTKDLGFVFPVKVTTIDSNEAHGFVECEVDSYNSKWLHVTDPTDITNYFTTDIECEVLDDNMSNFMDEFNNSSEDSYDIINHVDIGDDVTEFTLPGDPIYVVNNAPYVYTRLNYMFNETIPNRFYDDDHQLYSFKYIGDYNLYGENNTISVNMIKHNFQPFTENELHTILRMEPNDHEVYKEERRVFAECLDQQNENIVVYTQQSDEYYEQMIHAETEPERQMWLLRYEDSLLKLSNTKEFAARLTYMIEQPEPKSTWYNVRSYEAAMVYMNNGRSVLSQTYLPNISFIEPIDAVNLYVYDWENKYWINPEYYTINITTVDGVNFGNKARYFTDVSAYKIDITFESFLPRSRKLLVYIGYDKSDLFDDIQLHDKTCYVRFKPLLTTTSAVFDPYKDIKIRKHFDGLEIYHFDEVNTPEDFGGGPCYYIKRYPRNGNYQFSPVIRLCDMHVDNSGSHYSYHIFDLYVRNPFKDTETHKPFKVIQYNATVIKDIDNYKPSEPVKLICISNNNKSKYNGLLSSVIFEGVMGPYVYQRITINESSLGYVDEGHYICTVLPSSESSCSGGLIDVEVTYDESLHIDTNGRWIRIPHEIVPYHELPDEFVIRSTVQSFHYDVPSTFTFNPKYVKYIDDELNETNDHSLNNPYEYYHDTKNNRRLPISDTRHADASKRLVVDTTLNEDVKLIKTTYISVCRYSLNVIPENGFIDVTGFIPTPLSRDRYEFYVNGRIINGDNIIILSPTSFQLINLTSLKNFELIELVDDTINSPTFQRDNVYVSTSGQMFSSYERMLLSDNDVINQDIRYIFNIDQQSDLFNYTLNKNPNNKNIESDILDDLAFDDTQDPVSFKDLYNIPSINGVLLAHQTPKDLGLVEINEHQVLTELDKTWKREILTDPYFPTAHFVDRKKQVFLHSDDVSEMFPYIENPEDWICIYATGNMNRYFTMYVSKTENGVIDDTTNTLKIIPFVRMGMYVLISNTYRGKWLHMTTTVDGIDPAKPIIL